MNDSYWWHRRAMEAEEKAMSNWMLQDSLPIEDHPAGCKCYRCQFDEYAGKGVVDDYLDAIDDMGECPHCADAPDYYECPVCGHKPGPDWTPDDEEEDDEQ